MTILTLGEFQTCDVRSSLDAIRAAGRVVAGAHITDPALEGALGEARCVLVRTLVQLRETALALRSSHAHSSIPIIAVVDRVTPAELFEYHAAGADDVLPIQEHESIARVLARAHSAERQPSLRRVNQTCLLAHADAARRGLFARVLAEAGFQVEEAQDADGAMAVLRDSSPSIAVVSNALPPEGGRRALRRAEATHVPSVLLSAGRRDSFSPQGWAVVSEAAPPDELLFVANELLNPQELLGRRASRRILYATLCGFRVAGQLSPRFGMTYNIGRDGVYVRTFDPPAQGSAVWLELHPPTDHGFVHLRGHAAWTRAPSLGARTAPPGFGVVLDSTACPPEDLARLRAKYDWLNSVVAASEATGAAQ